MALRFFPKEENFFLIFRQIGELLIEAVAELSKAVSDERSLEACFFHLQSIESRADALVHHTVELLHKTFITPFDRDDIHKLVTSLDDVVDLIEAAVHRMYTYKVTNKGAVEINNFAEICMSSAKMVAQLMNQIEDMRKPEAILATCVEINRMENDADQVLRRSIKQLFEEEEDVRRLIKLKEIYELLERITDACENVANIVEGIVLDYA